MAQRNDLFRLMEGMKVQVREKNKIVEKLTGEDAEKMKIMLQLRNKLLEAEKSYELEMQEESKMMEEEFRKLAKSGKERLGDGEVRIKELSEQEQALKEIEKKKALYELELFEWGEQCRKV